MACSRSGRDAGIGNTAGGNRRQVRMVGVGTHCTWCIPYGTGFLPYISAQQKEQLVLAVFQKQEHHDTDTVVGISADRGKRRCGNGAMAVRGRSFTARRDSGQNRLHNGDCGHDSCGKACEKEEMKKAAPSS